eukprot:g15879.t1
MSKKNVGEALATPTETAEKLRNLVDDVSILRHMKAFMSDAMRNTTEKKKIEADKDCQRVIAAAKVFTERSATPESSVEIGAKSAELLDNIIRITEGKGVSRGGSAPSSPHTYTSPVGGGDDSGAEEEKNEDEEAELAFVSEILHGEGQHSTMTKCLARIVWKLHTMDKAARKDIAIMRVEFCDMKQLFDKISGVRPEIARIKNEIQDLKNDPRYSLNLMQDDER